MRETMKMSHTDPQFKLRLPQKLKEQVERAAEDGGRTISSEIIRRLEWSFSQEPLNAVTAGPASEPNLLTRIASVEARLSILEDALGEHVDISDDVSSEMLARGKLLIDPAT